VPERSCRPMRRAPRRYSGRSMRSSCGPV
jgi:hypothetical protein